MKFKVELFVLVDIHGLVIQCNDDQIFLISLCQFERRFFLRFVSGTPILPFHGWPALQLTVAKVSLSNATDENNNAPLPTCNTCQKYFKLPTYKNYTVFANKLKVAITEGQNYFAMD